MIDKLVEFTADNGAVQMGVVHGIEQIICDAGVEGEGPQILAVTGYLIEDGSNNLHHVAYYNLRRIIPSVAQDQEVSATYNPLLDEEPAYPPGYKEDGNNGDYLQELTLSRQGKARRKTKDTSEDQIPDSKNDLPF